MPQVRSGRGIAAATIALEVASLRNIAILHSDEVSNRCHPQQSIQYDVHRNLIGSAGTMCHHSGRCWSHLSRAVVVLVSYYSSIADDA